MRGPGFMAAALAALLGCGVRGPPRPPLREVATLPAAPALAPIPTPAPGCESAADAGAPAPNAPPPTSG